MDWLKKGVVIRDYVDELDDPKVKMAVVVGIDSSNWTIKFVLINSRMTEKIRSTPGLRERQVPVGPNTYTFLRYASYINCTDIISRPLRHLEKRMKSGVAKQDGELSSVDLAKILQEINKAATVKPKDKKVISSELRFPPIIEYR